MAVSGVDVSEGLVPGKARPRRVHALRQRLTRPMQGEDLRARAVRGAAWTVAGFGANQVIRLASTLILTRLLFPEVFGLMSLANVFLTGLQMFSDIGIRPSIIQNARGDDEEFLNTAWTMQVVRGFVLWAVACAIAYPVAAVYNEPVLFAMLCVLGSTAAIRGFQTTGYATANRKLVLGKLTGVELVTHLNGLIVTVVWAMIHPTVWALVGGSVVSSVFSVTMGHRVLNTHRHRLRWEPAAARELIRFGKWIFVSTALTFLSQSGDKLLLPHVLSIRSLSFYSIALTLLMIPVSVFRQVASRVLFPVYSVIVREADPARIDRVTWKAVKASAPLYGAPLVLIFFAVPIIDLMYDQRYADTGYALSILAIGGYLAMMRATQAGLLIAAGRPKYSATIVVSRIVACLPAGIFLAQHWGLEGFCAGFVAGEGFALLVQRYLARRAIPGLSAKADVTLLLVLLAAVVAKAVWLVV